MAEKTYFLTDCFIFGIIKLSFLYFVSSFFAEIAAVHRAIFLSCMGKRPVGLWESACRQQATVLPHIFPLTGCLRRKNLLASLNVLENMRQFKL